MNVQYSDYWSWVHTTSEMPSFCGKDAACALIPLLSFSVQALNLVIPTAGVQGHGSGVPGRWSDGYRTADLPQPCVLIHKPCGRCMPRTTRGPIVLVCMGNTISKAVRAASRRHQYFPICSSLVMGKDRFSGVSDKGASIS